MGRVLAIRNVTYYFSWVRRVAILVAGPTKKAWGMISSRFGLGCLVSLGGVPALSICVLRLVCCLLSVHGCQLLLAAAVCSTYLEFALSRRW